MALDPNSFPRADLGDPNAVSPVEQKIPFGKFMSVGTGSRFSAGVSGTEAPGFGAEEQA